MKAATDVFLGSTLRFGCLGANNDCALVRNGFFVQRVGSHLLLANLPGALDGPKVSELQC